MLAEADACMRCLLAARECGGPGPQPRPTVPRALRLLCNPYWDSKGLFEHSGCNTRCAACCRDDHGHASPLIDEEVCEACEAERCPRQLVAAPPPA